MALWAEVDPELDATAWCEACEDAGLVLARPSHWAFAPPAPNALRLAYSELRRPELRRAAEILAADARQGEAPETGEAREGDETDPADPASGRSLAQARESARRPPTS